jgi:hypothetical protein
VSVQVPGWHLRRLKGVSFICVVNVHTRVHTHAHTHTHVYKHVLCVQGRVLVAEWDNHRIQILNPDYTHCAFIGFNGNGEGEFRY